ncbi:hypothetical protein StrepF001_33665 [Streptomyces sp. F001]|uniref:hypothetical protein n=1 Tax=Streptomyces sp. F001 TaxID=1510026 RepID=UPI00101E7F56|nr:hypothetical protein [Streptomyces sp. F001]RZB15118.1 hypothetical protein StrepF001_33665 [Streptomyces sp. F001]
MGEQQNGGGSPGRRHVHPDGTASGHTSGHASGPAVALDDAELEALLSAAVLRGHRVDAEGEQRAVAAFQAARDAGAHRARTRRRDDWRPREQRRLALSVKTTLSLFIASLALGGVAVATIGSSDSSDGPAADQGRPTRSTSTSDLPVAERSSAASDAASGKPDHPSTAQDTEAQCRAYDQVRDRGNALDSTAWQRLVTAAGGEDKVAAYCAEQPARAATSRPSQAATPGGGAAGATNGADDNRADNGESRAGNVNSGAGGDQADKATVNGKKN